MKEGHGKFYFSNGDIYEGTFKSGNKHGSGKIIYVNGTELHGEWKDDKYSSNLLLYNNIF